MHTLLTASALTAMIVTFAFMCMSIARLDARLDEFEKALENCSWATHSVK